MLKTWDFICDNCGMKTIEILTEEDRDNMDTECPVCGEEAYHYKPGFFVSTSKLSKTYIDGLRRRVINEAKADEMTKRALKKAVATGDKDTVKQIKKERKRK